MSGVEGELRVMWGAVAMYVLAGTLAIFGVVLRRLPERTMLGMLAGALALHGVSIAMRWVRVDHGPFITMFEVLSSNVWSLTLVFTLACWRLKPIRPSAAVVMPILFMMLGWQMVTSPREGFFPPTYDTPWLYVHVFFGKIFLGAIIVGVGLAGVVLLRRWGARRHLERMPDDRALTELAYRFMALGLIFDTLMLIAGAIWAQDAWGRYWSWDPLETWAFVTWLLLGFAIHARLTFRLAPAVAAAMVLVVFSVSFLTFFGLPFISTSFHKGAV